MEKYFSIGSYNCLDAVMMNGCSADKVVEYMNKGIGDFHPYDEDGQTEISAEWLIEKYHGKITEDVEYIVVYDVSDRFNDVPLDLVLWNADDEIIEINITNNGNQPQKEIIEGGGLSSLRTLVEQEKGEMYIQSLPIFKLVILLKKEFLYEKW